MLCPDRRDIAAVADAVAVGVDAAQIEAFRDRTLTPAFAVIRLRLNKLRLGLGRRFGRGRLRRFRRRRFRPGGFCRLLFGFGLLCFRCARAEQQRQHQQTCNRFFIEILLLISPKALRGFSV